MRFYNAIFTGELKNTFHKHERLSSKKQIDALFAKGSGKTRMPLKIMYLFSAGENQDVKVMFVVPKKKFKKAHDRNKLRRRIREAYRLQKNAFYASLTGPVELKLAFIYTASDHADYIAIQSAVTSLLDLVTKQIVMKGKTS